MLKRQIEIPKLEKEVKNNTKATSFFDNFVKKQEKRTDEIQENITLTAEELHKNNEAIMRLNHGLDGVDNTLKLLDEKYNKQYNDLRSEYLAWYDDFHIKNDNDRPKRISI